MLFLSGILSLCVLFLCVFCHFGFKVLFTLLLLEHFCFDIICDYIVNFNQKTLPL